MINDQGAEFTVGYLASMVTAMLASLKTQKEKKAWIDQLKNFNGDHLVEVKNLMTGQMVKIPRAAQGTCIDPSQERCWSM